MCSRVVRWFGQTPGTDKRTTQAVSWQYAAESGRGEPSTPPRPRFWFVAHAATPYVLLLVAPIDQKEKYALARDCGRLGTFV
jgi:hypothetical protein